MSEDIIKYEYAVGTIAFEYLMQELNAKGAEGWELVTCEKLQPSNTLRDLYNVVLKRPLL